jgi:hypothetical protein
VCVRVNNHLWGLNVCLLGLLASCWHPLRDLFPAAEGPLEAPLDLVLRDSKPPRLLGFTGGGLVWPGCTGRHPVVQFPSFRYIRGTFVPIGSSGIYLSWTIERGRRVYQPAKSVQACGQILTIRWPDGQNLTIYDGQNMTIIYINSSIRALTTRALHHRNLYLN